MQSASRYIIAAGLGSYVLSIIYFLSLALYVPFFITVPVVLSGAVATFVWVVRRLKAADETIAHPVWAWLVLLLAIYLMSKGFLASAEQYGGWDAWGIWNLHARYMADGANWRKMFQNISLAHADYPLYMPLVNGFFIRLLGDRYTMVLPFILQFGITLCIPVLIYIETVKKSIMAAAAVLLLFAVDAFFLTKGATQYADTALAFFFLCAFVSINYAREDTRYIIICALSLGCCMWTKNEGSVLAAVFTICYADVLFSRRNVGAFVAGIGVPLLMVLLFKFYYLPEITEVVHEHRITPGNVFIKDRYDLVWNGFKTNVAQKYYYVKICLFLYLVLCVAERKWPDRQFFILLCCVAAYLMIYVIKRGQIEWLLDTSEERLMHQLMPALMYVFALRFARVRLSLPGQQQAL